MSTVWDRSAEFIGDNFRSILPIAALAFFIPVVIVGSMQPLLVSESGQMGTLFILLQLVFFLLSLWGSVAVTGMALGLIGEQGVSKLALSRLPAVLVVSLVWTFVIVIAAGIVLLVPLILTGTDMEALASGNFNGLSGAQTGIFSLSVLLLAIAMLWIGARLVVLLAVIVQEGRWFSAFPRAFSLTRGSVWRIIGVLILYALIAGIATLAATAVFGSVFTLIFGASDSGIGPSVILTSIISAVVQTIFTVIGTVFTAKLYQALTQSSER